MTLSSGSRLGPYEVLTPLGAGGMGEVYRARDTRLGRTVAIKILPQHLPASPEARQRFEREAKTISQLSHPHICALYDVGREGETEYLVMEYLEGETLADRLAKGLLSLEQTLRFGIEIADALDKAHGQGIVHRDLKPGNVMITGSGVKLLDFGLARVFAADTPAENLTSDPTTGADLTKEGTVLGTLSYMAPEQLEGKRADARTDIFAFGSLLYEMASGRRAFAGTSQASIFSVILRDDPAPITAVAPLCPPALDRLIRTCLAKNPTERWQSAHDVGLQLRAIQEGTSVSITTGASVSRRARFGWLPWALAAVLAGAVIALLLRTAGPRGPAPRTIRFSIAPPPGGAFVSGVEAPLLAVSPDGSQLIYVASDPKEGRRLWLRALSALEARPLAGTERASSVFWSPDGRSIAFFAEGKLKRLDLSGGAAVALCDVSSGIGLTGSWSREGEILFASVLGGAIYRVSASGGRPAEVIRPDTARGEWRVIWPSFLPDGRRFLYLSKLQGGEARLMLAEPGKSSRAVMSGSSIVQYVDPGYLLFARDGALLAQRFDPARVRPEGNPFSVAEHVQYFLSTGWAGFAASSSGGTLAYQSNEDVRRMVWFDRTGRELGNAGSAGNFSNVAIAPDGRRVLFDNRRPGIGTNDVWSFDVERGVETRITSDPDTETGPVWLRDGGSVVYSVVRGAPPRLFRRDLSTGREEALLPPGPFQKASDVSPDGKTLLYDQRTEGGNFTVWALPVPGPAKPVLVQQSQSSNFRAHFSPDGRYIAFLSNDSGRYEVYVAPFPGPGERTRISAGGAQFLRWSSSGEILYLSDDRRMMSVRVRTAPSLEVGAPAALFSIPGKWSWVNFDVSPDGQKILAIVPEVVAGELPLTAVVNWAPETK